MNLQDFLAQYPHIVKATAADNDSILKFYHQSAMSSADSDITYLRGNDFFSFLNERSHSSIVLLMKDDDGVIQGMGVLSFRPGYINGELQTVGYLGDLRVKLNRKLIREWRSMYANLIKHSPQMADTLYCRYYQTVLIDENIESKNNLAETKIANLFYQRLMKYHMVNIIGRLKTYKSTYRVSFGSLQDDEKIKSFLNINSKSNQFAHDWNQELPHRLKNWNRFNLTNFILVYDLDNQLIALSMLWNPITTKQIKISKIPKRIHWLHRLLSLLPFIELKKLPISNQAIDILYLHQFHFSSSLKNSEKKKILSDVIHFAFKEDCHMLAYADFEYENFLKNSLSLFSQKMPMALYSVHYKENDGTVLFPLNENETVTFDMSLV